MSASQQYDANYKPVNPNLWDPVGQQWVPQQAVNVISPAGGTPYAAGATTLSAANTGMAASLPAIVQKAKNVSSGSVTSLSQAFTSNNTAGNSIIVVCGVGNGTAATVTDSLGNTYNLAVNGANSTTFASQIFYAVNILGGSNTITVTPSASVSVAMEIYECSGLLQQVVAQPEQSSSGSGTGTTASTSNIGSSVPNALAFLGVAVGTAAQAVSVTSGTGWTLDSTQNVGGTPSGLFTFGSLSQALPEVISVTSKATIAGSEPWAAAVAVFKPVAFAVQGSVQIAGYNYTNITTATTTAAKNGTGVLHAIVLNTPVASATATIYDNTAGSGTKIGTVTLPATLLNEGPVSATYDVLFATGLTIVTTGTADWTFVWK